MDPEYRERLERDAELDRLRVENAELRRKLAAYEGSDELHRLSQLQYSVMNAPNLSELINRHMEQSYVSPLAQAGYTNVFDELFPWR